MTPERWRQVTEVFHAALTRDGAVRPRYLDEACAGEPALRADVDAMLAAHAAGAQFGETPVHISTVNGPRLTTGTMIGSYRIDRLIGTGGMGEVYRARDTRLGRDVAIKILSASFAADPDRVARFEREARLLAALNHPHIAAIYGLEETGGVRALVLELVEGNTLTDRLTKGPVPVKDALEIARQITEALEAAHEHGIVHRDLKPANIKVTPEGIVKVLDFGLAKAFVGDAGSVDLSQVPTVTVDRTQAGVLAGTPAYMSPEQARGQAVDKRTDIWAFGCVLYEMLTARPAFPGETLSDTIAAILDREPQWDALPDTTPTAIGRLLRRCLAKDRRQRLSDTADARLEIDEALAAPTNRAMAAAPAHRRPGMSRRTVALAICVALLAAELIVGAGVWFALRPVPPRVTRTMITPSTTAPLTTSFGRNVAIAPDGSRLVYVAGTQLVVRALDQLAPTVLSGLGDPTQPVFSPDGQWIAFFDGLTALKKVPASGGTAVTLARLAGGPRGAWAPDDSIIFAVDNSSTGLLRVSSAGGEPEALTTPDRAQGDTLHFWPEVLPGGEAVLFTTRGQVAVLHLQTGVRRMLLSGATHAQYVAPGYLVYAAAGVLRAVPFDLDRLEITGAPVPVIEGLRAPPPPGMADVSVAADGTLVYVSGGPVMAVPRTVVWVDRNGKEEELGVPVRPYRYPRLSPDGTKVAVEVQDPDWNIWIWDLSRQTSARLTLDPAADQYPVWTPDGRRIVFRSSREGPFNLYSQAADGTGTVERLSQRVNEQSPYAITPDDRHLVLREDTLGTGGDLMVLALDGDRRVSPLVNTAFNERNAELSPDGRWLAYESDESGREAIYVRPFPDVDGGRWQVSTAGGTRPLWARNGRELFYWAPDGAIMGVAVAEARGSLQASTPVELVKRGYFTGLGRTYDVSLDGQRFLMIKESSDAGEPSAPPTIVVVQNWTEELKRLVPR